MADIFDKIDAAVIAREPLEELIALQEEGDSDILAEVIGSYLESSPPRVDAIDRSLQAGELTAAGKAAHGLKSSSRMLGALVLGDLCQKLEDLGESGGALDEARDLAARIRHEYGRAVRELEAIRKQRIAGSGGL